MSARETYPYITWHSTNAVKRIDRQQCADALDEIDRLRRWKAEAMIVLSEWDEVWIAAGQPGALGSSKAQSVRKILLDILL